ncbi:hypothetical protein CRUP_015177, partial [Coryphaenoides rupestris]
IHSVDESLTDTQQRYGSELARMRRHLQSLEAELGQLRDQVKHQVDEYQHLLHVKMKLEAEIENYRQLMHGITGEPD